MCFFFFKAACGRTRHGQRGRRVSPRLQQDLADRPGDQHQLHGNVIENLLIVRFSNAQRRRCLIPRVHLSSAQLEKAGDMVTTPPLNLTVTYPHHSPWGNHLLYLTRISTKPKVRVRPKMDTYTSTSRNSNFLFYFFTFKLNCNTQDLIDPLKIGKGDVKPNPKKETLGVYLLVSPWSFSFFLINLTHFWSTSEVILHLLWLCLVGGWCLNSV